LCMFLGTNFPANTKGLLWFVKEVFPHVDIRLQIVGKGMEKIKPQLPNNQNIELYGSVPDLNEFLENADLMILPIFKGSGMKVKTCEALMYGKNIIGTTEAFEGYEMDYNLAGGCCNTKSDFIKKIEDFISSPRPRFNTYSREIFLEKYSEQSVSVKFKVLLGSLN